MGLNPSKVKGDYLPVSNVSWTDCQKFINKLNNITGRNFRLPTEAEWEFAARGGNNSKKYRYSGSNVLSDVAWFGEINKDSPHLVGSKNLMSWAYLICLEMYMNGVQIGMRISQNILKQIQLAQ